MVNKDILTINDNEIRNNVDQNDEYDESTSMLNNVNQIENKLRPIQV